MRHPQPGGVQAAKESPLATYSESARSSPSLVSLPQAARELAVAESTIRRWIKDGELPAIKVGPAGRYKIELGDLYALRRDAAE